MTSSTADAPPDARSVRALFLDRFGRDPDVVASAPGRVNLIGEHTDYNGGEVLPIAISRRTWVAVGRRAGDDISMLRAASATQEKMGSSPLVSPVRSGEWWDYLVGVAAPLLQAATGSSSNASLDVAVMSDVPAGAGLSSSAALEVATALGVGGVLGIEQSLKDAALTAWRAETGFVGVACGIMDQFASALCRQGEALHLECDTATYDFAPFRDALLIFDTAIPRSLRTSHYNERRAECDEALRLLRLKWPSLPNLAAAEPEQVLEAHLPDPLDRRALHVSQETRRVRDAVASLRAGGCISRELLVGSHISLRDLYECSRPELDWVVDRAITLPGVRGARLTGAGWGGCVIVVGDEHALREAGPVLAREYEERFRLTPRLWLSTASSGARLEARVSS
ncbi:MAG TPA: galactokinase [Gemmatimonadaceae bacterium]|jgi:galactokinase|nr:galactokinase [Gemmatimonadaceae bacterium]